MLQGIWIVPWDGVAALATVGVAYVGQQWAQRVRQQDQDARDAAQQAEDEEKRLAELRQVYLPLWDVLQNLQVASDDWMGDYSPESDPRPHERDRNGSLQAKEVAKRFRELKLFMKRRGVPTSEAIKQIIYHLESRYESTQWIRGRLGGVVSEFERPTPIVLYGEIIPNTIEAARRQMATEFGPRSPI
jgi:hypothetical protein